MQRCAVQIVLGILLAPIGPEVAGNTGDRGVVVIANRTDERIEIRQADGDERAAAFAIAPGVAQAWAVRGRVAVRIGTRSDAERHLVDPDSAYELRFTEDGKHQLSLIEFSTSVAPEKSGESAGQPSKQAGELTEMSILTIPVMILVDEEEPLVQRKWEPRLRERLQVASRILEEHCRVRFEVVQAGVWQSDNRKSKFSELLSELENVIASPPARLVIGFTSQRRIGVDKTKMGGTRIPLHSHILIREWSKGMSDRERVEVLVHELGHFLGATHSPDTNSVMRSRLVDGRSNRRDFRIQFDPLNTLIMNLVAEDMRHGSVTRLRDLSTAKRHRLYDIYANLSRALPDDPGAAQLRRIMARAVAATATTPLTRGVRDVLVSMMSDFSESAAVREEDGDELTNACVRRAAVRAAELSDDVSARAFLLSLGLAMDHTGILLRHPQLRAAWNAVESDPRFGKSALEFPRRLSMHSRFDLAQHFWVSAALVVLGGEHLAFAAGVTKELRDANGGSGFSFADLAADIAGIEFGSRVLRSTITVKSLSQGFRTDHFLIDPTGLPEGLSLSRFQEQFGTVRSQRFRREEQRLRERILALPGYQSHD